MEMDAFEKIPKVVVSTFHGVDVHAVNLVAAEIVIKEHDEFLLLHGKGFEHGDQGKPVGGQKEEVQDLTGLYQGFKQCFVEPLTNEASVERKKQWDHPKIVGARKEKEAIFVHYITVQGEQLSVVQLHTNNLPAIKNRFSDWSELFVYCKTSVLVLQDDTAILLHVVECKTFMERDKVPVALPIDRIQRNVNGFTNLRHFFSMNRHVIRVTCFSLYRHFFVRSFFLLSPKIGRKYYL